MVRAPRSTADSSQPPMKAERNPPPRSAASLRSLGWAQPLNRARSSKHEPSANELQLAAHLQLSAQTRFTLSGTRHRYWFGRRKQAAMQAILADSGDIGETCTRLDPLRVDAVVQPRCSTLAIASVKAHSQDVDVSQWSKAHRTPAAHSGRRTATGAEQLRIHRSHAMPSPARSRGVDPAATCDQCIHSGAGRLNLTSLAL